MNNKLAGPVILLCALGGQSIDAAAESEWNISGLLREEATVKTTSDLNGAIQSGIPTNGEAVTNTGLGAGINPTLTRPASFKHKNNWNMFATRLEINLDGKLSENLQAHFKLRGFSDQIGLLENEFKDQNLYQQSYGSAHSGARLASAGKNWTLDLPVAYLDYSNGPLWLRLGNQQIAWGEAIFFRVADTPNGLDLRRNLLFDVASEEFSDKRVPAIALRGSYRAGNNFDIEGFAQQFQPTIYPAEYSPYNPIPAQFVIDQHQGYEQVKNKLNFGVRLRGNINDYGVQAFAVRRHNPDGVFRWTAATGPGAVAGTPFTMGTGIGVYSAKEWFTSAALARLDGIGALDSALNEFVANTALAPTASGVAGACGATSAVSGSISNTSTSAACVLDTFFDPTVGFGNLRGTLIREYLAENIFGFGVNHVFAGNPGDFLDQLIGRFEMSYTPNKKLTNPTLSRNYLNKDEIDFAFVFEKWQRFSESFPATYMVAQWLHKSDSDLFGRSVSGLDNTPGQHPKGQHGFDAVAFVAQQASPTLEYRFDVAVLTDLKGGWLFQPGVKWKPSKSIQVDLYGNVLATDSKSSGKDFAQGFMFANEVLVRTTWYF